MKKSIRAILATNEITTLGETMDSRTNKKDVEHCMGHAEASE